MTLPSDVAAWESAAAAGREFGAVAAPSTILVVDLEATCANDGSIPAEAMETIEIGACWATPDGQVLYRFQCYVRPLDRPKPFSDGHLAS